MIDTIVFSRDRPCQLDLLLRSLTENDPGFFEPINVIWRASASDYFDGYTQCASEHPEANFIYEERLAEQVRALIAPASQFITFFTDDDVLFRPIDSAVVLALDDERTLCFSLRLGANTTTCYPLRRSQRRPKSRIRGEVMSWYWSQAEADYGYPGSVDGHIFRVRDILPLVQRSSFATPNFLEDALVRGMSRSGRPLMASYIESRLVSIPANMVNQSHTGNRVGEQHPAPTALLLKRYLSGQRIDLAAMDFSSVCGAHHELPYVFR